MEDRWYVYRDDQELGPFDSAEIRQMLRDGDIDPFDQVSRDGSNLRRELVEVDEIFQSSKLNYVEQDPDELARDSEESALTDVPSQIEEVPVAKAGRRIDKRGREKKENKKRFHLVDGRKRVLGPLSAAEVQSLYFRGMLDKGVKVIKRGSDVQVPILKFVTVYSEARKHKAVKDHGHQRGVIPPSPVLAQISMARSLEETSRWYNNLSIPVVSIIVLSIAAIVAGAAFWSLSQDTRPNAAKKPAVKYIPKSPKKPKTTPRSYKPPAPTKDRIKLKSPVKPAVKPVRKPQRGLLKKARAPRRVRARPKPSRKVPAKRPIRQVVRQAPKTPRVILPQKPGRLLRYPKELRQQRHQ